MSFKNISASENLQSKRPSKPQTAALIVAAGSSVRFGEDKLMATVHGKPLITYSLQAFAEAPCISAIILVVPPKREEEFSAMIAALKNRKLRALTQVITGGSSRHESVQRGIAAIPSETHFIAIHDAARPLITPELIELCLEKAYCHGASSLAVPVTDTLHRADNHGYAEKTVDRENLWAMQTPQVFRLVDLVNTLTVTGIHGDLKTPPTDEVSALIKSGIKVHLVENCEPNIKVTYRADLALVTALLKKEKNSPQRTQSR